MTGRKAKKESPMAESGTLALWRMLVADETNKNARLKEANVAHLQKIQASQGKELMDAHICQTTRIVYLANNIAQLSEELPLTAKTNATYWRRNENVRAEREEDIQNRIAEMTREVDNLRNKNLMCNNLEPEIRKMNAELSAVQEQKVMVAANCERMIKRDIDKLIDEETYFFMQYKQEQQIEKNKVIRELNEHRRKQLVKSILNFSK